MCGVTGAVRGIKTSRNRALGIILLRIAHATQGQHGGMAGLEREFAGQVFAGVGFDTAGGLAAPDGAAICDARLRDREPG
jgi:hypothetical protein